MKRIFVLLLTSILCTVSCERFYESSGNKHQEITDSEDAFFEGLIQKARSGNAEAYLDLASCYLNGNGGENSAFNAIVMYQFYCDMKGCRIDKFIKSLPADNQARLFYEIMDCPTTEDMPHDMLANIMRVSPAEAIALEAARAHEQGRSMEEVQRILEEAERAGSEAASIALILMLEEQGNEQMYLRSLYKNAERFPIVNVLLGKYYLRHPEGDNLEKAIRHYMVLDEYAIMTEHHALCIDSAFRRLEIEGKTATPEMQEKHREIIQRFNLGGQE